MPEPEPTAVAVKISPTATLLEPAPTAAQSVVPTTAILYANPVIVGHTVGIPAINPGVIGVAGLTVTPRELAELVPQLFVAVTLILPFWPVLPDVTVIEFVPTPPVIVHPVGTVQVYDEAFATAAIL